MLCYDIDTPSLTVRAPIHTYLYLAQTPSAVNRVKELLVGKTDVVGLKIGVKQRGCNGLSYTLDYAKGKDKLDEEVVQDGVRIYIDRKAQLSLLGECLTLCVCVQLFTAIISQFASQFVRHRH